MEKDGPLIEKIMARVYEKSACPNQKSREEDASLFETSQKILCSVYIEESITSAHVHSEIIKFYVH